mgnify:CR=1 FL=1
MQSRFALKPPFFTIGFKSYLGGIGESAVKMAKIAAELGRETQIQVMVIPQVADIYRISQNVDIPILAPHMDGVEPGGHNGAILAEAVKEAGAIGSLINHRDKRLTLSELYRIIRRSKQLNLITAVCADSPEQAEAIASLTPEIIVAEPPELIGTRRAVSTQDPGFITETLHLVKKRNPDILVAFGGGIHSKADAAAAIRLGSDGTGASNAIINAKDPYNMLRGMLYGVKEEWRKLHK